MASFLSDGDPVGYIGDARHEQFKRNMLAFAAAVRTAGDDPVRSVELRKAADKLFDDYFGSDA